MNCAPRLLLRRRQRKTLCLSPYFRRLVVLTKGSTICLVSTWRSLLYLNSHSFAERLGALSPYHEIPREFVIVCDHRRIPRKDALPSVDATALAASHGCLQPIRCLNWLFRRRSTFEFEFLCPFGLRHRGETRQRPETTEQPTPAPDSRYGDVATELKEIRRLLPS